MFCNKCGNSLGENQAFCTKCGRKLEASNVSPVMGNTPKVPANSPEIANVSPVQSVKTFSFIRHKSIARLDLSHTITQVHIEETSVNVLQQKVVFYFFKKMPQNTRIEFSKITSIRLKTTFDVSDTIFASLLGFFAVIFLNIFLLMGAGVLLWVGYGRRIEIHTNDGTKIIVPAESNNDWQGLIGELTLKNPHITVLK